jgi:hypothetical protein
VGPYNLEIESITLLVPNNFLSVRDHGIINGITTVHEIIKRKKKRKRKKKGKVANQADEQYTNRNKLDLAVPRRPFPNIV